jgi:hypothetical protein
VVTFRNGPFLSVAGVIYGVHRPVWGASAVLRYHHRHASAHERTPSLGARAAGGVASTASGVSEELAATPPESRERRERLEWQIRRAQKRLGEVEARLAGR